jgi:large repetitive protein
MWWTKKRNEKRNKRASKNRPENRRHLRFEGLEDRRLLAGLVDVQVFPLLAPGRLDLVGDLSNNEVRMSQTVNVGEYRIDGLNGTLLQINGAGVTMPSVTVNGITGDIRVYLGDGNDTLTFDNTYAQNGQRSDVPVDLYIENSDGSNTNQITDVMINGDLNVIKAVGTTGHSELHVTNTTVIGYTTVDNTGGGAGGDTATKINNAWLQGNGGPAPAFVLTNGDGNDIIDVQGNSQFGIGPFPLGPVIVIDNAAGASRTTFTGAGAEAGFGTTTVYGDLVITNGANLPGTLNTVTFNGSNVLGNVGIDNGDGNTSVTVNNSTLGSHLVAPPFAPVLGGSLQILNDAGFDQFAMTDSTVPWGILVNNDVSGNNDVWGSATSIAGSFIGTAPFGPSIVGFPGAALVILGDNGRDVVNIGSTELGGTLDLQLFNGNNAVSLTAGSSMNALSLVTGTGNDSVLIDNSRIAVAVYVRLDSGADEFFVRNVNPATQWPSALLGMIDIDGGIGVDTTNLSALALGALGFEIFVP